MADRKRIHIEVVYALVDAQPVVELELNAGATANEAIRASGLLQRFPKIDLAKNRIGVFGSLIHPDTPLQHGDRVEIYRPLMSDPKEARRARAQKNSAQRAKGGRA